MKKTPLHFCNVRKGLAFPDIARSLKSPPVSGYDLIHKRSLHLPIRSGFSSGTETAIQMLF